MKLSLDSSLQTARRATVGRSALGWIALLCLLGSSVFWLSLFTNLLAPPTPWSPQAIQAFLMVVAYALILPLFWSMLLPTSPAGRLLQKQSWAMPGSIAVIAAALFLTYYAGSILLGWWSVQPTIRDTGSALFLTITSLIAAVLVPALSWCVVTPEQWIAQIEQARHVKRIEHAMRMEETAMRAAFARAVSLLNADLTNLTLAQKRELAGILGGFARMQQQAMHQIAASWKDMYGVEAQLATIPDRELLDGYRQVADLLTGGAEALTETTRYATQVLPPASVSLPNAQTVVRERSAPPAPAPVRGDDDRSQASVSLPNAQTVARERSAPSAPAPAHGDGDRSQASVPQQEAQTVARERSQSSAGWSAAVPPRTTDGASANADEAALLAARRALGSRVWMRRDLEQAASIQKTKASQLIAAWRATGHVIALAEPANHYQLVEV